MLVYTIALLGILHLANGISCHCGGTKENFLCFGASNCTEKNGLCFVMVEKLPITRTIIQWGCYEERFALPLGKPLLCQPAVNSRVQTKCCFKDFCNDITTFQPPTLSSPVSKDTEHSGVKIAGGFIFIPARLTYDDAREHCQRRGGDLAVPKDQADIDLITRTISSLQKFRKRFATSYYIGMKRDPNRNGDFYWINGTRVATRERNSGGIHNWLRGKPSFRKDEICAAVRNDYDAHWIGVSCNHRRCFICELPGCSVNPTPGMRVNPPASITPIGERAAFSCELGYRLIGEESMTCLPGAKWSHHFPACVATPKLRFQFETQRKNYDDARKTCRAAGGDLAQPRTRKDIDFITKKIGLLRAQGFLYDFYFGIKRPGINKEFKWLNGTRVTLREDTNKSGISNWRSGDPKGPYLAHCAVVRNWHHGYWNDIPCWYTRYFICENEFNPCAGKPCRNEGRCIANGEHFRCDCPANKDGQLCERERECPAILLSDHLRVEYNSGHRRVGSIAIFSCETNYKLKGSVAAVCRNTYSWSANAPVCEARGCRVTVRIPDGVIIDFLAGNEYSTNHQLPVRCKNRSPPTSDVITCQGAGVWRPSISSDMCN